MIPLSAGWSFSSAFSVSERRISHLSNLCIKASHSAPFTAKDRWVEYVQKAPAKHLKICLGLIAWVFVQPSSASFTGGKTPFRITAQKPTSTKFMEEFLPFYTWQEEAHSPQEVNQSVESSCDQWVTSVISVSVIVFKMLLVCWRACTDPLDTCGMDNLTAWPHLWYWALSAAS